MKRLVLPVVAALSLTTLATTAFAADTVTQDVTAGSMSASVANLGLTSKAYSHANQNSSGSMTLTVDDSRGSGAGWHVTIQTSDFDYTGANGGTDIPAANFTLTSAGTPSMTAGQAVDGTDGPKVPSTSPLGGLDSAREVIEANANFGQGTYTQALGVTLLIPGQSKVGTYTGTLTTTAITGP